LSACLIFRNNIVFVFTKPSQKRLERKPQAVFGSEKLIPSPIGVINRRNGCSTALWKI